MTASVFERLFYLPVHNTISVIASAFGLALPFLHTPRITHVAYWPRWELDNRTVEPDVFFRIEDRRGGGVFDFIVEAKPSAHRPRQSREQLEREAGAYQEQFGGDADRVFMLAIGGLGRDALAGLRALTVGLDTGMEWHACDWLGVRRAVETLDPVTAGPRLRADILASLDLAGHRDWQLFHAMPPRHGAGNFVQSRRTLEGSLQ